MNYSKSIFYAIIAFIFIVIVTNCSSAQKLQNKTPGDFGEVYFQKWTAGVQGGGSGINLFISLKDSSVKLDSVFFRGKVAKLETKPNNPELYIGRFDTKFNQPKDIILSSDMNEEANNKLPQKPSEYPFDLDENECVVSYNENNQTTYYKLSHVKEKQALNYPSAPPNKQ